MPKMKVDPEVIKSYIKEWAGKKPLYVMHLELGASYTTMNKIAKEMQIDCKVPKETKSKVKVRFNEEGEELFEHDKNIVTI